MNSTNITTDADALNIPYTVCEVLVATLAVIGNAMVIIVFRKERRLRRRTNYYIISLATADFLVGLLGIPFAILASVGLPTNLYACLFTVSLLVVLCTISIFCLVAVSIDRYWAILHPMGYSRNVRTKTALVIISVCWVAGSFIGFLPLLGWYKGKNENQKCYFVGVMDYNYLVFLYFATIITPSLLLTAFYAHIYRVVLKQLRQIVTMNPCGYNSGNGVHIRANGGTMLRMLGAAQKREVKATQNLSIIVLFFMICWIPLYTINCVQAFCVDCKIDSTLTYFCIILSHLNSAGNPVLYAYHLRDFRAAMKSYLFSLFGIRETKSTFIDRYRASQISNNQSQRNNYIRNVRTPSPAFCNKFIRAPISGSNGLPICVPIMKATTEVSTFEMPNRDICTIDEVSSEHNLERKDAIFPDSMSVIRDMPSDTSSSGKINSGYIDGSFDDMEMGDDDVFYPDESISASDSKFSCDSCEIFQNHNKTVEIVKTSNKIVKNNSRTWCLSKFSPPPTRLFLVEAEINNSKSLVSEINKNPCDNETISIKSQATNNEYSPTKSLKLVPFKTVGEYLLQHSTTNSNSVSKIEEVPYTDLSFVPSYDASNKNGTVSSSKPSINDHVIEN